MCRIDNKMIDKSSDEMSWNRFNVMYFGLWTHLSPTRIERDPGKNYSGGGGGGGTGPTRSRRGPVAPQEGYG
jgi:hypothetical protein